MTHIVVHDGTRNETEIWHLKDRPAVMDKISGRNYICVGDMTNDEGYFMDSDDNILVEGPDFEFLKKLYNREFKRGVGRVVDSDDNDPAFPLKLGAGSYVDYVGFTYDDDDEDEDAEDADDDDDSDIIDSDDDDEDDIDDDDDDVDEDVDEDDISDDEEVKKPKATTDKNKQAPNVCKVSGNSGNSGNSVNSGKTSDKKLSDTVTKATTSAPPKSTATSAPPKSTATTSAPPKSTATTSAPPKSTSVKPSTKTTNTSGKVTKK